MGAGGHSNNRSTVHLLMWGQVGIAIIGVQYIYSLGAGGYSNNRSTVHLLTWGQVGVAIIGVQYICLLGGRWV